MSDPILLDIARAINANPRPVRGTLRLVETERQAPRFIPGEGCVYLGPARLSEASVNAILDVFEAEGCAPLFNDLYLAGQVAGFIPRCSPMLSSRRMLEAAVDLLGGDEPQPPRSAA